MAGGTDETMSSSSRARETFTPIVVASSGFMCAISDERASRECRKRDTPRITSSRVVTPLGAALGKARRSTIWPIIAATDTPTVMNASQAMKSSGA